jgi:hypothetical protein
VKPQLFPAPAAGLIKNSQTIRDLERLMTIDSDVETGGEPHADLLSHLFLLIFLNNLGLSIRFFAPQITARQRSQNGQITMLTPEAPSGGS